MSDPQFEERHAANVVAAQQWWHGAPARRLLGDHSSLNATQQARLNGAALPWPAIYDVRSENLDISLSSKQETKLDKPGRHGHAEEFDEECQQCSSV